MRLSVDRSAGSGACVLQQKVVISMHDSARQSGPVVLVVEDESLIRMQTVAVIDEAGYNVIEASNTDEAIAILEKRKDIRIVVTDIEMPGSMDGLKLARAVRDRWPPIELIVTSGRYHVGIDDLPSRAKFMAKPYTSDGLVTALRTMNG